MTHTSNQGELVDFEALPGAAAVAEAPSAHFGLDLLDSNLEASREAFHDDHEALAMGLTGSEETKHRTRLAAGQLSLSGDSHGSGVRHRS